MGSPEGYNPSGRRYGGCASINYASLLAPFLSRRGLGGWSQRVATPAPLAARQLSALTASTTAAVKASVLASPPRSRVRTPADSVCATARSMRSPAACAAASS